HADRRGRGHRGGGGELPVPRRHAGQRHPRRRGRATHHHRGEGTPLSEQEEQRGAGLRDAFARLWTPHRMAYIKGEGKGPDCAFCEIPTLKDEDGLVVARGSSCYAVLNLYPY